MDNLSYQSLVDIMGILSKIEGHLSKLANSPISVLLPTKHDTKTNTPPNTDSDKKKTPKPFPTNRSGNYIQGSYDFLVKPTKEKMEFEDWKNWMKETGQ